MKTTTSNGHEVLWDGRNVWVNSGEDGSSIGRFGRGGIDVHKSASEQMRTGKQCIACSPDPSPAGWVRFRELMEEHYNVIIPETAKPTWV